MKIISYTVKELREKLENGTFWSGDVIPITRHRALAQVYNPRAAENDIILIVAYNQDKVIGYTGILPDFILSKKDRIKFGWQTTWWVDPNAKSGIGYMIYLKTFSAYDGKIGSIAFSNKARKVYEASNKFFDAITLKGQRFEFFNHREIAITSPINKAKWFYYQFKFKLWKKTSYIALCELITIDNINEETNKFITTINANNLFKRAKNEFEWIKKYPWVLDKSKDGKEGKYFFSDYASYFNIRFIKVLNKNKNLKAFLVIKERDNRAELAYSFYDLKDLNIVVNGVQQYLLTVKLISFDIYDENIALIMTETNFPYSYKFDISRRCILSKKLETEIPKDFSIQPGDGDCIFT